MFVTIHCSAPRRAVPNWDTLGRTDPAIFQLLAQCLVREWRSVMAIIERELYLENIKAASFFPTVTV